MAIPWLPCHTRGEGRPFGLGSARSVIEVRNPDVRGVRERTCGEHRQTKDADHAGIACRAGRRVSKCLMEHEHRRDPEDEDGEVEGVLDRPSGADGRKAVDRGIRTDDQAHEDEHEDEEQGASKGGEPAPSKLLSHRHVPPLVTILTA